MSKFSDFNSKAAFLTTEGQIWCIAGNTNVFLKVDQEIFI